MESENIYQTMDAITNAICDSCEPRIRPEVTLQTVDDKTIIIVEVLPGSMRPYYIKSKGMMNITLNTLTSWGILREEHGNVMPTNAYALLNGKCRSGSTSQLSGTGIPRIFRECEEYGLPEPKLIDFDGDFRVNMYRRIENEPAPDDRVNDKVNNKESEKAVLSLLMENPEYTVTQLADMLNVSRKTIANKMKVLKEI